MVRSPSVVLALLVICPMGLIGCSRSNTTATEATSPRSADAHTHDHGDPHSHDHDHAHSHTHGHAHGHTHGGHGGHLIELGDKEYHAELTLEDGSNLVRIYLLGADSATPAPIEARSVAIDVSMDGESTTYTLPAVSPTSDEAAGESAARFELESEPLLLALAGQQPVNASAHLRVTIDGKDIEGKIDTQIHAASHSHAEDDALIWHKEVSEQGYEIALGHHGVVLLAGADVEPAILITREGQPVADAQVFNTLLADDGTTILAEEKPTIYEPPTSDEPAHYAQGSLRIPPGTRQALIRYRIVLPEEKGERLFDVPVAVK